MKKRIGAIVMMLVLAVSLGGCSTKPQEQTDTATATAEKEENKDLEEFDVVLDWYPNAVHAFIYEAIEKGYYEEEGLHVNIRFPASVSDGISLPAAGKADLGIFYLQNTIIAAANEDVPIRSVGAILQSPLNIIMSLKEKNITSPADLVGKTIGYSGSTETEAIIKSNMENVGADTSDVKLVDVGFDLMSSMTTGNVDATIGCMVNHEVPQMEEEGFKVNYFFPTDYGVPNYYELVFLAGNKQLKENPEKIEKFLRASKRGFEDMKANPEEALGILLKNQNAENFPLSATVERKSMATVLPIMETENAEFLSQTADVWQKNADWLVEKGVIPEKIDAGKLIYQFEEQE